MDSNYPSDDVTSFEVNLEDYDTHGLCSNYTLRRHKYESEANAGCHEARSDWIRFIGPVDQFGGCNPVNGNFSSLAYPLCKPERLRLLAYVLECRLLCFVLSYHSNWLITSQMRSYMIIWSSLPPMISYDTHDRSEQIEEKLTL
jgi:hypothetical protein